MPTYAEIIKRNPITPGLPGGPDPAQVSIGNQNPDRFEPLITDPVPTEDIDTVLSRYGVRPDSDIRDPVNAFSDTYMQLYNRLGLPSVREQLNNVIKEYDDLKNEFVETVGGINENPWLPEGNRQKRIAVEQEKHQMKLGNLSAKLGLLQNLYQSGRQEAQYITSQASVGHRQERGERRELVLRAIDMAERASEAKRRAGQTDRESLLRHQTVLEERRFKAEESATEREFKAIEATKDRALRLAISKTRGGRGGASLDDSDLDVLATHLNEGGTLGSIGAGNKAEVLKRAAEFRGREELSELIAKALEAGDPISVIRADLRALGLKRDEIETEIEAALQERQELLRQESDKFGYRADFIDKVLRPVETAGSFFGDLFSR